MWLSLPLVLFGLVLALKWRADNPPPTNTDLVIRAMMLKAATVEVLHIPRNSQPSQAYKVKLSSKEIKPLAECFYISPQPAKPGEFSRKFSGRIEVTCFLPKPSNEFVAVVVAYSGVNDRESRVFFGEPYSPAEFNLHPVTMKRWVDILLADPRLNPQLPHQRRSNATTSDF